MPEQEQQREPQHEPQHDDFEPEPEAPPRFEEPGLNSESAPRYHTVGSNGATDSSAEFLNAASLNVDLSLLRHHAGEAAVGASAGAAAAWLLHRLQSTVMMLGVLGSIGTAAALHLQWVAPDQVRAIASAALRLLQSKLARLVRAADLDEDGEITLEDSNIAYSKLAPLVRKHTALTGGLVGGFVTAYSSLR